MYLICNIVIYQDKKCARYGYAIGVVWMRALYANRQPFLVETEEMQGNPTLTVMSFDTTDSNKYILGNLALNLEHEKLDKCRLTGKSW